jgi:hypothetical protein
VKTSILLSVVAGASFVATATPATAAAQSASIPAASSAKGLFLGAHLDGSSRDGADSDTRRGGGVGLQLGYGVTTRLALFAEANGAVMDDGDAENMRMAHVDVGVRYAWTGRARRWVPSLELAATRRAIVYPDGVLTIAGGGGAEALGDRYVSLTGTGVTFGGAVQYYSTPTLAIGAALKVTEGVFDRYESGDFSTDVNMDIRSTRLDIGVTWYPFAGR